jgi:OOP family OmpA-OmpF porin
MKTLYRTALLVLAFLFLQPLSARSEIKAGSFEVTPFAGYNFFQNSQNLKDHTVYGGRLGYYFTEHFGVELTGDFIKSSVDNRSKTDLDKGEFGSPADTVHATFYNIDAIYHLIPEGAFNPYISAGVGGTHYSPSIKNRDMTNVDFGLGAKAWLTDNLALRIDLRDHVVSEVFRHSYHNFEATLGMVFAFGGSKASKPAAVAKYEPLPEAKVKKPILILASEPQAERKLSAVVSEPTPEAPVIILAFEDIHFDFNKSTLTTETQALLKKSIRLLNENSEAKISIAGYTSASGSEAYNQKLSERRATAVYDYLTEEGLISPDRLTTIGYGEMRPAMHEAIPKNIYSQEAKANMRVLFEVIVK